MNIYEKRNGFGLQLFTLLPIEREHTLFCMNGLIKALEIVSIYNPTIKPEEKHHSQLPYPSLYTVHKERKTQANIRYPPQRYSHA